EPAKHITVHLDPEPGTIGHIDPSVLVLDRCLHEITTERMRRLVVFEDRLGRGERRMRDRQRREQMQRRDLTDRRSPYMGVDGNAVGVSQRRDMSACRE